MSNTKLEEINLSSNKLGFATFDLIVNALIKNKLNTKLKILKIAKTLIATDDFLVFGTIYFIFIVFLGLLIEEVPTI